MDLYSCETVEDYDRTMALPTMHTRWLFEQQLAARIKSWRPLSYHGYCQVCRRLVRFRVRRQRTAVRQTTPTVSWREDQICSGCRLNARSRMMLSLMDQSLGAPDAQAKRIWIMEQRSRFFSVARTRFPDATVIGSEYLGPDQSSGTEHGGVRHEDVMRTSFRDQELGLIVSNDVFEHVAEPASAIQELSRITAKNGVLILTVPFHAGNRRNRKRASVAEGRLTFLEPAEYHYDPLDGKGALVYTDFGWELLESLRSAGFVDTRLVLYWSYELGQLGVPSTYIRAAK